MQDNVITLAVDEANNSTTVNTDFTRFNEYQNRSEYMGDNHALDARDLLAMSRSFPTQNGNFKGVAKTSFKFTRDQVVDGVDGVAQLTSPIILEVNFSVPVGVTSANLVKLRQTALALLDDDSIMDDLNLKCIV